MANTVDTDTIVNEIDKPDSGEGDTTEITNKCENKSDDVDIRCNLDESLNKSPVNDESNTKELDKSDSSEVVKTDIISGDNSNDSEVINELVGTISLDTTTLLCDADTIVKDSAKLDSDEGDKAEIINVDLNKSIEVVSDLDSIDTSTLVNKADSTTKESDQLDDSEVNKPDVSVLDDDKDGELPQQEFASDHAQLREELLKSMMSCKIEPHTSKMPSNVEVAKSDAENVNLETESVDHSVKPTEIDCNELITEEQNKTIEISENIQHEVVTIASNDDISPKIEETQPKTEDDQTEQISVPEKVHNEEPINEDCIQSEGPVTEEEQFSDDEDDDGQPGSRRRVGERSDDEDEDEYDDSRSEGDETESSNSHYSDAEEGSHLEEGEEKEISMGPRQSGDGEEEKERINAAAAAAVAAQNKVIEDPDKPVDADNDKLNPAYVPRTGRYFMHDCRQDDEDSEQTASVEPEKERRRGINAERWGNDMFSASNQAPKSHREIIKNYGYDIRKESSFDFDSSRSESVRVVRGSRGRGQRARGRSYNYADNNDRTNLEKERPRNEHTPQDKSIKEPELPLNQQDWPKPELAHKKEGRGRSTANNDLQGDDHPGTNNDRNKQPQINTNSPHQDMRQDNTTTKGNSRSTTKDSQALKNTQENQTSRGGRDFRRERRPKPDQDYGTDGRDNRDPALSRGGRDTRHDRRSIKDQNYGTDDRDNRDPALSRGGGGGDNRHERRPKQDYGTDERDNRDPLPSRGNRRGKVRGRGRGTQRSNFPERTMHDNRPQFHENINDERDDYGRGARSRGPKRGRQRPMPEWVHSSSPTGNPIEDMPPLRGERHDPGYDRDPRQHDTDYGREERPHTPPLPRRRNLSDISADDVDYSPQDSREYVANNSKDESNRNQDYNRPPRENFRQLEFRNSRMHNAPERITRARDNQYEERTPPRFSQDRAPRYNHRDEPDEPAPQNTNQGSAGGPKRYSSTRKEPVLRQLRPQQQPQTYEQEATTKHPTPQQPSAEVQEDNFSPLRYHFPTVDPALVQQHMAVMLQQYQAQQQQTQAAYNAAAAAQCQPHQAVPTGYYPPQAAPPPPAGGSIGTVFYTPVGQQGQQAVQQRPRVPLEIRDPNNSGGTAAPR